MKKSGSKPYIVNSISELHRIFSLPKPEHPLISVIDLKKTHSIASEISDSIVFNFYSVWLEKDVNTKMRYGQQYFDFEEGAMIFIAPGQVLSTYSHLNIHLRDGRLAFDRLHQELSVDKNRKNLWLFFLCCK